MPSIPGLPQLPATLTQRIFHRNKFQLKDQEKNDASFVLYLPTVNLRMEHNPGFALACHLANASQVPLIVLAVVLDDAHMPTPANVDPAPKPIVFTARRIAFVLEALQQVTKEWEFHGAGVAIRVHGPQCRNPHHLTLARKATAVVTDEPFVNPYRKLVDSVEQAVQSAKVPLFTVDGSTTVPPLFKLQKKTRDAQGRIVYMDSPSKAWAWEKKTHPHRKDHVLGAVNEGHLDAPNLQHKLKANFFVDGSDSPTLQNLPDDWKDADKPAPGKRAWTVAELASIVPRQWVSTWPGIDTSVPPCEQTHGSTQAGMERWNRFRDNHLRDYANKRNQIGHPHSVSRMSCYLNYGVVSIFRVVSDSWEAKGKGAGKFIDEVVKWREIGYVHAFAKPDYNTASAIPSWALNWLAKQQHKSGTSYPLERLALGNTKDDKWNAMQRYLVETGELHNNARMTWGKTMLHWQKMDHNPDQVLYQMVYVNDRYALDGLSPPSYAGLLWCFGWCDKPSNKHGAISEKSASRYRASSGAFAQAKQVLLAGPPIPSTSGGGRSNQVTPQSSKKLKTKGLSQSPSSSQTSDEGSPQKRQKSIDSYFKVTG